MSAAPLAGLKVIELARILAGPWAGQTLADLGAEVIKVESPEGDDTRRWGPPFIERDGDRSAAYFHGCNRGKTSVAVDFRTPEGQAQVRDMLADADIVIPVPDSGRDAAAGYAAESGLEYADGLVKNRYVGRTFIMPTQDERERAVRLKLNPIKSTIEGKTVTIIDDSIVRGNTARQLVAMLRSAGAAEVHLRITSPPIANPCYYGIDMASRAELIGADLSIDEIRDFIGCDSLHYISLDGLIDSTPNRREALCTACFTGEYPIPVPGEHEQLAQIKFDFDTPARAT
jgi:amidophosphoribosyltransferase